MAPCSVPRRLVNAELFLLWAAGDTGLGGTRTPPASLPHFSLSHCHPGTQGHGPVTLASGSNPASSLLAASGGRVHFFMCTASCHHLPRAGWPGALMFVHGSGGWGELHMLMPSKCSCWSNSFPPKPRFPGNHSIPACSR